MDRIIVPEVQLEAHLGVTAEEREVAQQVSIGVELHLDLEPAGSTDAVTETVDYEAVCLTLATVVGSRRFRLVEAVAEAAARAVLERFPVREIVVTVRKPGALLDWGAPYAAVEIRRGRDG